MYHLRRRSWTIVLAAVVALLGALIVMISRPGHHPAGPTALTSADQPVRHTDEASIADRSRPMGAAAAAAPAAAAARKAAAVPVAKGVITLRGPLPGTKGSWVVFALQGPRKVVRSVGVAPWTVRIDTRTLPNGVYRVTEVVLVPGGTARRHVSPIRIANPPGSAPVTPAPTVPAPRPTVTLPAPAPTTAPPAPPAPQPTATLPPAPGGGSGLSAYAAQVLTLTNTERAKAGCGALTANSILTSVALAHSVDMATNNYFDHNSPNGQTPFDRMKAAGYSFSSAGENIAAGQPTPQAVMTAWMNSPGHKANILNCSFKEIGIGYTTGGSYGSYWTQDFGTKL